MTLDKEWQKEATTPALLTVKQFSQKHDWPIGGLRHLIFHQPNGFDAVIRKVGRKVLLHEGDFFRWIDEINSKRGSK